MYIHVHHICTFSRFMNKRIICISRDVKSTALIRIAIGSCLYKKNRTSRERRMYLYGRSPNARYRRSVKAPIADYHVPVAAQESHQFFSLSRDLACVNGCAFHSGHVRNSRVLRALTTDLARED